MKVSWMALRRDAFRRSGGVCQCRDCGGHVGQCTATLHPGPGGYEADHVLPKSRGGPDVPANLRATCPECNRRKSNRLTALPKGPLARAKHDTYRVAFRLARVGLPTLPIPATIAPHVITWRLFLLPGHAHVTTAAMAEARAAAGPGARVYVHGAELRIEVPRSPRMAVPFAEMPAVGLRFGIGRDAQNQVAWIDLADSPHVLVAGASGSGKSEALRVIIGQLAKAGAEFVLVDCDGETFDPFARLARLVCAVARDTDAAHDAVCHAQAMMDARPLGTAQRPLVLAVDEVSMLDVATRDVLVGVAKRGRKRATFVIVATHRPTRDDLPKVLTDQLTWSLAGKVGDLAGSRVIIGQPGAERLAGRGDMLLAHGGDVRRIQAAIGDAGDWAKLAHREAEPAPAPRVIPPADARYARKPDDAAVAWAVERARETGQDPSAKAIQREFGGAMDAARRRRDAAFAELASA